MDMTSKKRALQEELPTDVDALARKLEQHQQSLVGAIGNIKGIVAPPKGEDAGVKTLIPGHTPENMSGSDRNKIIVAAGAGVLAFVVLVAIAQKRKSRKKKAARRRDSE